MSKESKQDNVIIAEEERQDNSVVRFLFEDHGVRGEIMHMQEPLQKLLANHQYPPSVTTLMQELAVASVLIAATLKANGEVTVQLQGGKGHHAVRFAFVNIDKDLTFYGSTALIEDHDYQKNNLSFKDLAGEGAILVISVFPEEGNRYQGIVALEKDSLAECLEDYFKNSEQLATKFFIHSSHDANSNNHFSNEQVFASGIMLQIIPNIENNLESLEHLATLSATMTKEELNSLSLHECLRRLFWNDQVRVFDPQPVHFKCICSKARCIKTLLAVPLEELTDLAQEEQGTEMTCHNCGQHYAFSQEELKYLVDNYQNAEQIKERLANGDDELKTPSSQEDRITFEN